MYYPNDYNYCGYRLPCGYCSYTNGLCPYPSNTMPIQNPHITWTAAGTGNSITTNSDSYNVLIRKEMEKTLNCETDNTPSATNPCERKEN